MTTSQELELERHNASHKMKQGRQCKQYTTGYKDILHKTSRHVFVADRLVDMAYVSPHCRIVALCVCIPANCSHLSLRARTVGRCAGGSSDAVLTSDTCRILSVTLLS